MSRIRKTLKAQAKIAMSFIGRTYARLRNIQKLSKLRLDAVQLVIKEALVCIFVDGVMVLEATRHDSAENDWNIGLTNKLHNLLQV